jgi:transposase-like protein
MRTLIGRAEVRYSEAFKIEVVRELEQSGSTMAAIGRRYGIRGRGTLVRWLGQYGRGTHGRVIRVEKPEEINELQRLRQRVRRLESALADSQVELAVERAYVRLACQRAGIEDVAEFKKKADGGRDTRP